MKSLEFAMIVAIDENGAIGRNNKVPWNLSADMKNFKACTMGHPLIMGRKTHESILDYPPKGEPLLDRHTIVMTHQNPYPYEHEDVSIANNKKECLHAIANLPRKYTDQIVIVCGGADIYKEFQDDVQTLFVTRVHTKVPCADTFFPFEITSQKWLRTGGGQRFNKDEKNEHDYSFLVYTRRGV